VLLYRATSERGYVAAQAFGPDLLYLVGFEAAKARFVLQNSLDLTCGSSMVTEMIEIGLVRVVCGLTRVLDLRWVHGLSPEEGLAAWRALKRLRISALQESVSTIRNRYHNDIVDASAFAISVRRRGAQP
jgi:hypothetical protein